MRRRIELDVDALPDLARDEEEEGDDRPSTSGTMGSADGSRLTDGWYDGSSRPPSSTGSSRPTTPRRPLSRERSKKHRVGTMTMDHGQAWDHDSGEFDIAMLATASPKEETDHADLL